MENDCTLVDVLCISYMEVGEAFNLEVDILESYGHRCSTSTLMSHLELF
jgi:hypothetical protein